MNEPTILEQVKEAGYRTRLKYPGDSDSEKASRAIEGYELGFLPLRKLYKRKDCLRILDYEGRQMFGASERHIRRVETIREKRPLDAARLERVAIAGELSLELTEWFVNHPPTVNLLEALWLMMTEKERREFLTRIRFDGNEPA